MGPSHQSSPDAKHFNTGMFRYLNQRTAAAIKDGLKGPLRLRSRVGIH